MSRGQPGGGPIQIERRRQGDRRASVTRLAALEADRWRSFDDAQREADTMFAQYQLSQLLASGAGVAELSGAVLDELLRHDEARAGALWLTPPGGGALALMAAVGVAADSGLMPAGELALAGTAELPFAPAAVPAAPGSGQAPATFPDARAAAGWCRSAGWSGVALEESRDTGDTFEVRTVGLRRAPPGAPRAAAASRPGSSRGSATSSPSRSGPRSSARR